MSNNCNCTVSFAAVCTLPSPPNSVEFLEPFSNLCVEAREAELKSDVRHVYFSEELQVVVGTQYDDTNPLLAILNYDYEFKTQSEFINFIRLSLTKMKCINPGLSHYSAETQGPKWRRVVDAYDRGEVLEDIHELIVELFPYIVPPDDDCNTDIRFRKWKLDHIKEILL